MKALRFAKTGDLGQLRLLDMPQPEPAAGEVLVRIRAAGLNHSDVSNVLGKHPYTTLPRTPGRDFAGVVVAGPTQWIGREVWGTGKELGFTRDGTHGEFLALPADGVAEKPSCLTFTQAAACGVPYTTAWSALERCEVGEGTRLLVVGAGGAVGTAAINLARWRGARVAGAVRRPHQAAALAAGGIECVVLPGEKSFAQQSAAIFPQGAEVVLDTTGEWLTQSLGALAFYGRVGVIVAPASGDVKLPVRDLYRRGASVVGINSLLLSVADCARILEQIGAAFDARRLPAPESLSERPLAEGESVYAEAHRRLGGRFVLVP